MLKGFQFSYFLPNLFAGLIVGLAAVIDAISVGALIFSGDLANYLPFGLSNVLLSSALLTLLVALSSSFAVAGISLSFNGAAILAPMAISIASSLKLLGLESSILPTIWTTIALSTLLTGVFLFAIGRLHLSRWIRFIPYPVVGGFLAGTGWLLTKGGLTVMTGVALSFEQISHFLEFETLLRLLPGIVLTAMLLVAERYYQNFWALPSLLIAAIALSHLPLWLTDTSLSQAIASGWFLQPFESDQLGQLLYFSALEKVDWVLVVKQSGSLIAIATIISLVVLLNATGLEIALQQDVDLDSELQANGIANLLVSICGGTAGHITPDNTLLNSRAGATNRLSGLIAALFCGAILCFGGSLLAYIPMFIVGGLNLYLGLSLLKEWVYDSWFKLSHFDYVLVLAILAIVASFGFLEGVGVGILIACLMFVVNYSRLDVVSNIQSAASLNSNVQRSYREQKLLQEKGNQIYIFQLQGYIFFGSANTLLGYFRQRLENPELPKLQFLVLDFRLVSGLDSSAVLSFTKMKQIARQHELILVFTTVQPEIRKLLRQGSCLEEQDPLCQLFPDLDHGLEWCEDQIINQEPAIAEAPPKLPEQLAELFLNAAQIPDFMSYLEPLQLSKGDFLFMQGEPSDGLYFVESGQVSIFLDLSNEKIMRLRTFRSGTIVGEMGLYGKAPRSASVIVDQPTSLYYLSTKAFEEIESEAPVLAAAFHKFIVSLLAERLKYREQELHSRLIMIP